MMRMNSRRNVSLLSFWVATVAVIGALSAGAAVKKQEKTQVKFTGFMGGMMKMFGGNAANEGVVDTVAVKGDRKFRADDTTGQIVDLSEEKVYDIDIKGKSYKVSTFDQIRQRFIEDQQKAKDETAKMKDAPAQPTAPPDTEMQFDLDAKVTGQSKTINGFQCVEAIMTITA